MHTRITMIIIPKIEVPTGRYCINEYESCQFYHYAGWCDIFNIDISDDEKCDECLKAKEIK